VTRRLKLAHSASGTPPRPTPPSSGQTPAQPPPEEQRRAAKLATRSDRTPRAWDPVLDLSGLLWLVHPDDATDIISDEINAIPDRVAAHNFDASAAANRMPLNLIERPGHQVADAETSNEDILRLDSASVAQGLIDNASGAFTLFSFHRHDSTAAGSVQILMAHGETTNLTSSGVDNRVRLRHTGGSPGTMVLNISDASSESSFTWGSGDGYSAALVTNWTTWIVTYDGAGTAELWANGVSLGTKSAVHRAPSGMLFAWYGGGASGGNFVHHGPKGACAGVLNADDIAELHDWLLAVA
jgi:hypothetical protein